MSHSGEKIALVADVGGTNTRVAFAKGGLLLDGTVQKFRNSDHASLQALLARVVDDGDVDCIAAAVAIAGPVEDGRGRLTNLDWSIDRASLAEATGARVISVLNDLQAQAHGLTTIRKENLRPVVTGAASAPGASRLVIGIGTGFNAALAIPTPQGRVVPPSECGHTAMPVLSAEEGRLAEFIAARTGFPSVEDVLSGRGLENVFAWHAAEAGNADGRPAAEIMSTAEEGDALARAALGTFVRLAGAVAGDLALVHLPFGGVYLIGGVARAVSPYFDEFGFIDRFRGKGRFEPLMARFPISVIEDDFAALAGLAAHLDELS